MAVKVLIESATLSISAGSWRRAEAAHFGLTHATASADLRNTTVVLPVTFANACNATGIFVIFRQSTYLYVTVNLQENVAGTWTDRATAVIDKSAESKSYLHGEYIAHAPYAVDTAANKWRYTFFGSTVAYYQYLVGSAAATPFYAVTGDADTAKPATDDVIVLANDVTLTVDESLSLGAEQSNAMIQGDLSVFQVVAQPAAAITLEADGWFPMLTRQSFLVGSAGSPMTAQYPFTLSAKMATAVFRCHGISGLPEVENTIALYGEQDAYLNARVAATANAGQPNVVTTADRSSHWSAGDTLKIVGADQIGIDTATYTISSISGTTITLTDNLSAKILKGGSIVNLSRSDTLGIRMVAPTKIDLYSSPSGVQFARVATVKMVGVSLENVMFTAALDTAAGGRHEYKSILCQVTGTLSGAWSNPYGAQGHTYEDIHLVGTSQAGGFPKIEGTGLRFKNITVSGNGTQNGGFFGNGFTIDGFVFGPAYDGTVTLACQVFGSGHAITDLVAIGSQGTALGCQASTFTRCSFQKSKGFGVILQGGVGNSILSSDIGGLSANATADISFGANTFSQTHIQNTAIATIASTYPEVVDGSWLRVSTFNRTANDHRGWRKNGIFFSDANRLVMRHTGSAPLTTQFLIGTNDVTDLSVAVLLHCQMAAAYYAGTHVLPKMTVDYDAGTLVTQSASASTARQRLAAVFSPTASYNTVGVALATETDATGADADVYWDTLTLRARRYGKVFSETVKYITEMNAEIIAEIPTPADDPFITEANAATVAAYTGIAIDHGVGKITVTQNHSIQELYDFVKHHLTLEANMDEADVFTTIDGTTYACAYDLTVDGCTLAGTGKRLDLGAKTFTAANGGATSATVTDVSGTLVALTLTNVVVGSRCRIEKVSDGTALLSAVATGTTVAANYTHTADVAVRVRVRHASATPKYLPWESPATVTANGLTLIVSQVEDPIAEAA
ncbi:MAG: hypothetical protein AB1578_07030 [Thermodesulfobacteriota bacterium]